MSDFLQRLNDLRARVLAGQEVTREEYKEIVQGLRSSRRAGESTTKKKSSPNQIDTTSFFDTNV